MSSVSTTEKDFLNLRTYDWAEWVIFSVILLVFGLCWFGIGICYHKWRMKNHILTDDDIADRVNDNKVTFRGTIRKLTGKLSFTPKVHKKSGSRLFSPSFSKNPTSWSQGKIRLNLEKSVDGKQIKQGNITKKNGKMAFTTLDADNPPTDAPNNQQNPMLSMTESQIEQNVGQSFYKTPSDNTEDLRTNKEADCEDETNPDHPEQEKMTMNNNKNKNEDGGGDDEMKKMQSGVVRKSSVLPDGFRMSVDQDVEPEIDDEHPPSLPVAFGYGFSKGDINKDNEANMEALTAQSAPITNGDDTDVVINTGVWILNGTPR